jgi:hypothetical protein
MKPTGVRFAAFHDNWMQWSRLGRSAVWEWLVILPPDDGTWDTDSLRNFGLQEDCVLGCCAVQSRRNWPTFFRGAYQTEVWPWPCPTSSCILTYFFARGLLIALMMEAESTSEKSSNFYQISQCNIPEGVHLHPRRRENLKSHHK